MPRIIIIFLFMIQMTFNYNKIPIDVGMGYHLFNGDPNNKFGFDPGFTKQIFQFIFKNKNKTVDGKYLIPDQILSNKILSCSFIPSIPTFRGTTSYQNQLKKLVDITSESSMVLEVQFAKSKSIKQIYQSTQSENTVVHIKYSCLTYQLLLDKSNIPLLKQNFVNSAIEAYIYGKWSKFINQFGTNYVYSVQMGARTTYQLHLNQNEVSKIQNLDVNVPLTVKSFFQHYYNISYANIDKYRINQKYIQKILEKRKQINIGQKMKQNINISTWNLNVLGNQRPVNYKISPLTQLFQYISHPEFNKTDAVIKFNIFLQSLRTKIYLKLSNDFSIPIIKLSQIGIYNIYRDAIQTGNYYETYLTSATMDLRRVIVHSNNYLNNFKFIFSNGIFQYQTRNFGGAGGYQNIWDVPQGEYINKIQYRSYGVIDALTFVTNKGNRSPQFGGPGGYYSQQYVPDGYRIVGTNGLQADYIIHLGFYLGKTINTS